jgi:hypothetical protein
MNQLFSLPPRRSRHLVCLDLLRPAQAQASERHAALARRRVDNCRRMLAYGRSAGWNVIHVLSRSALSQPARSLEGLEPSPSEQVLYRTGVSAFSNRAFRQTVGTSPDTELVLIGLSLSPSCLATALAAHDHRLGVTLVEDTVCAGPEDALGLEAIETVSRSIVAPFVRIVRTEDLIDLRRSLRVVE